MAKTKISEFNANPALNTDIDSINISEGCAPSGINDAIRELMSQLKDWQSGTSNDPMVIGSSGSLTLNQGTANGVAYLNGSKVVTSGSALTFDGTNLGVGTASPVFSSSGTGLMVNGTTAGTVRVTQGGGTQAGEFRADANNIAIGSRTNGSLIFEQFGSEQMRLTSTGLGIGTSSPSGKLSVAGSTGTVSIPTNGVQLAFSYGGANYIGTTTSGGSLIFQTGASSTAATLDSSGNLGLGVTPSAWDGSFKALQVSNTSLFSQDSTGAGWWSKNARNVGGTWYYIGTGSASYIEQGAGAFKWNTAASGTAGNAITFTQAMTLGSSGELIIGNTTRAQTAKLTIQAVANATKFGVGPLETSSSNFFVVNGSGTGVYLADGATSWTANSDERLKDIIEPISDAVAKVSTLRTVIGKYKTDAEGTRRAFLIAQDVQAVLPEAVNAQADEQGTLGVQYTDTIPLLAAAIKEQQAIINSLKARLDAANL